MVASKVRYIAVFRKKKGQKKPVGSLVNCCEYRKLIYIYQMSDGSDFEFSDDEELMAKRRAEIMQGQTSTPQEAEQSDDAVFRSHFDRNHPNFHGGMSAAVPLGGQRVPDGMKEHANWRELPEVEYQAPSADDFGATYKSIFTERESLLSIKKAVANVLPLVAAVAQNRATLAAAPEDAREKAQQLVIKADTLRNTTCAALKVFVDEHTESKSEYCTCCCHI
jgi:hypothetical protein